jgi:hypothetical protein
MTNILSKCTEERLKLLEEIFKELTGDRFISLERFQKIINSSNVSQY